MMSALGTRCPLWSLRARCDWLVGVAADSVHGGRSLSFNSDRRRIRPRVASFEPNRHLPECLKRCLLSKVGQLQAPFTRILSSSRVPAGRAVRREGTNSVDPVATKGAISLTNGDDGLLHFIWKNRLTNEAEEVPTILPHFLSPCLTRART